MATVLNKGNKTLWTEFSHQVALHPNSTAVVDGAHSLSYFELQRSAMGFGKQIRQVCLEMKITNSRFVAILLPPGLEYITTMLSLFESSKTTSPLSVDYPVNKLEFMLEDLGRPLLITKSSILTAIGLSYSNSILMDTDVWRQSGFKVQASSESVQNGLDSLSLEEPRFASTYYTSGSTGMPKGVLMSHASMLHFFQSSIKYYRITSSDSTTCMLNPAFIFSGYEIWTSLLAGATINVVPNNLRYDVPNLREWIKQRGITIVCMVSSSAEIFIKVGLEAFSSRHRLLLCGGEKLQARPPGGAPFTVYSMYGSTETKAATFARIDPVAPTYYPASHTLAGRGFPGVEVLVLDEETLEPVERGETGEIIIGGPSISQGYFNRDEESSRKFFQLANGMRVCRTGDIGYLLPNGELVVLNRRDNQIKVSGYRFDLADLETGLAHHSSVDKAVAVVANVDGLRIHLFYKLKCPAKASPSELSEFLQNQIPHYAFPHSLIQVEDFPLTANGKLDKNALLLKANQQKRVIQPTITKTEGLIADTWAEVLGISRSEISRNDNFFAIGGTSMLALQVIAQLQLKNPEYQVEPFNVFKAPVLKAFAELLESNTSNSLQGSLDLNSEVAKYEQIILGRLSDIPTCDPIKKPRAILVTGATGYLGGGLVLDLLEQTEAEIYCLVRSHGSEYADGRERLLKCLQGFNMTVKPYQLSRLHGITGDLSLPNFGLPETEFDILAEAIDQVFHSAAEVHWLKRYEELRGPNVEGTMEVIRFASTKRLKFLHYVSTIGVLGICGDSETQLESEKTAASVDTEMGYTQSKWVAEKLVWKAIEAGVPGIVYRPGIIGSHFQSEIGTVNPHDFITLLFKTCKNVGAYPVLPWQFPYGSLDFTSKCIVAISQDQQRNQSKAFHTFQQILSFEDFFQELADRALERCSISEWKKKVLDASSKDPASVSLGMMKLFFHIPYYKEMTFFQLPFSELRISNIETLNALSTSEPSFQLLDEEAQKRNFASAVFSE